jgi:GNAT superfamily N-acetyltransferase
MITADGQGQAQSEIVVKALEAHEEQELLGFYAANLENWERFHVLWEWRKKRPGGSGRGKAAIAKQDGKIVGCVGSVPAPLTLSRLPIKGAWQQDSVVSSTMRGKGLGKKLVEEAAKGWDLVMAKGTSEAMYRLRKSAGYRDVPKSDYLVRVERPRIHKGELRKSAAVIGLFLWQKVLAAPTARDKIKGKWVQSFDKSFDRLAERMSNQPLLRLCKAEDYLNWRYVACPGRKYQIFRAGGEEVRGAIVLNVTGTKRDEGWFVDVMCQPGDEECAYALISEGLRYFRKGDISRVYAFATLPAAREWFRRFGFAPTGLSPRFTYKVCGKGVDPGALNDCYWDFWHGDGDVELYM